MVTATSSASGSDARLVERGPEGGELRPARPVVRGNHLLGNPAELLDELPALRTAGERLRALRVHRPKN